MFQRWFIRGVLIFLILLSIGGWAESYGHFDGFRFTGEKSAYGVGSVWGSLDLRYYAYVTGSFGKREWWHDDLLEDTRRVLSNGVIEEGQYFWGFGYERRPSLSTVCIPYYAFILVLSFALFVAWRKIRKPEPGRAFPVQTKTGP